MTFMIGIESIIYLYYIVIQRNEINVSISSLENYSFSTNSAASQ